MKLIPLSLSPLPRKNIQWNEILSDNQAFSAHLVEVEFRGCQGADLQAGEERVDAISDRRYSSWLPWRCSGEICRALLCWSRCCFPSVDALAPATTTLVVSRGNRTFPLSKFSGEIRDWNESSSHSQGQRSRVGNPRRSLSHDQEGRLHQKAFGEK